MTKVRLKEDVYSYGLTKSKKPKKYGSKGETVTVINEYGNTIIAEGTNGRFPVLKERTSPIN